MQKCVWLPVSMSFVHAATEPLIDVILYIYNFWVICSDSQIFCDNISYLINKQLSTKSYYILSHGYALPYRYCIFKLFTANVKVSTKSRAVTFKIKLLECGCSDSFRFE